MSGIYINGMEMPKKGEYRMTLYVCDDGYAYVDVDLFPVDKDRFEAVPVPPHGGLVDLKAPFKAQYLDEMTEEWEEKMVTVEDVLYSCMVDEMPSITIPADPAEGGE